MADVAELIAKLESASSSYIREDVVAELGKSGDAKAAEPLAKVLLHDGDAYVRQKAATALGNLGDPRCIPALEKAIADPDSEVRRSTAIALGEVGDETAIGLLEAAAKDENWTVREPAQEALDKVRARLKERPAAVAEPAAARPRDPEAAIEEALQRLHLKPERISGGFKVTIPFRSGRKQSVSIGFGGHDSGGDALISFFTICGPATSKNYEWALRTNPKIACGSIGVMDVRGEPHFVIVNTVLAETLDPEEVVKTLTVLARKGDAIERKLTGEDVR